MDDLIHLAVELIGHVFSEVISFVFKRCLGYADE